MHLLMEIPTHIHISLCCICVNVCTMEDERKKVPCSVQPETGLTRMCHLMQIHKQQSRVYSNSFSLWYGKKPSKSGDFMPWTFSTDLPFSYFTGQCSCVQCFWWHQTEILEIICGNCIIFVFWILTRNTEHMDELEMDICCYQSSVVLSQSYHLLHSQENHEHNWSKIQHKRNCSVEIQVFRKICFCYKPK